MKLWVGGSLIDLLLLQGNILWLRTALVLTIRWFRAQDLYLFGAAPFLPFLLALILLLLMSRLLNGHLWLRLHLILITLLWLSLDGLTFRFDLINNLLLSFRLLWRMLWGLLEEDRVWLLWLASYANACGLCLMVIIIIGWIFVVFICLFIQLFWTPCSRLTTFLLGRSFLLLLIGVLLFQWVALDDLFDRFLDRLLLRFFLLLDVLFLMVDIRFLLDLITK